MTGRTHQIRVHASHAGAPLLGDRDYGGPTRLTLPGGRVLAPTRIALHAAKVRIARDDGAPLVVHCAHPPASSRDCGRHLAATPRRGIRRCRATFPSKPRFTVLVGASSAFVCAPALVGVAEGAEGADARGRTAMRRRTTRAAREDPAGSLADAERAQWVFDSGGIEAKCICSACTGLDSRRRTETPRAMGRFALELFEGPTLIERVRFDFPMLGDEPRDAGLRAIRGSARS